MSAPVWIDLQVNGFAGVDFNSDTLAVEDVAKAAAALADAGTAGFCPTLITASPKKLARNLGVISEARKVDSVCHERILAVHLEGPFISGESGAVGAHDPQWVCKPDIGLFDDLQTACGNLIKLVTIAAEIDGAAEFTAEMTRRRVVTSLGHQMASTPEELSRLVSAGARALTHLGNGIPNFIHRHNNIIWSGLAEDRLSVMFIPDGHHLPKSLLKIYTRAVAMDRLIAVTDASHVAGLPPGRYKVLGNDAVLEPNGLLHNPNKKCLVGSSASMRQVTDMLMSPEVGLTHNDCLKIAQDNPLSLLGMN